MTTRSHNACYRWYNCTYALYASMILLFVVLSNQDGPDSPSDLLLQDSERCLEVFKTMDVVSVARKCAEITQEVLDVAKQSVAARQRQQVRQIVGDAGPQAHYQDNTSFAFMPQPGGLTGVMQEPTELNFDDELYAGLIDINLIGSFIDIGSGSLWPDNPTRQYSSGSYTDKTLGFGGLGSSA